MSAKSMYLTQHKPKVLVNAGKRKMYNGTVRRNTQKIAIVLTLRGSRGEWGGGRIFP